VSCVGWWGEDCSRFPRHGSPLLAVCRVWASKIVVKRCHPLWPVGERAVFAGMTGPVRIGLGNWGIGGGLLTMQLVVDRRVAHGVTL